MNKKLLSLLLLIPALLFAQKKNPNEWTVVATYEIPGKAGGITYDGTWLYSGLYSSDGDDNRIFKIDPADGSYELQCHAPIEEALGLTFDGTHFWSTFRQGSYDPALAVQFDLAGNLLSSFELPATYFCGIEYMEDGSFWATCYYDPDGSAFHLENNGTLIEQFSTPNSQPWAICQMDDQFWIADYDADMLYLVDETGSVIENHASIDEMPTGVVFDGTYLWYVAGSYQGNSILYQVDLSGSGNPILSIQPSNINLGDNIVDSSFEFDIDFVNSGGSDGVFTKENLNGAGLDIMNLDDIPDEITVSPNSTYTITVSGEYLEAGVIDLIQNFSTNDPLNHEIDLQIYGSAMYDGPDLHYNADDLFYTDIRLFANTRRTMSVNNPGNEDLIIEVIYFNHNSYSVDGSLDFPLSIPPLDTLEIDVWFHPLSVGDFSTIMFLENNAYINHPQINIDANSIVTDNSIGRSLWTYQITEGYDPSPKAMLNIPDINNDGVGEVVACIENNNIMCFNGNSHETADVMWVREIYSGNIYQQNGIDSFSDADEDGIDDFIVGTTGGDQSITCISSATGEIIWKFYTNVIGEGGWVYQVCGQKDFNGDGINDALAAVGDDYQDMGPKCVFLIDGSTGEEIWRSPFSGPAFSVIGVEDFTGDGVFDVLAGASDASESNGKIYGIDGSNGSIEWNVTTSGSSVWALTQLDDINGDDLPDVMAGDFGGNYYFLDATNGNIIENGAIGNNLILRFLTPGDINEDGYLDVLIASSSTNAYLIDGYTSDAIWYSTLNDKAWNMAVANDLNMDGSNDVMAGTLYQNNFSYFLDGANGDELSKKAANTAIDALCSMDDICRDWTMEMVVGDRDGFISCYSGGLDGTVSIHEDRIAENKQNNLQISPNPNNGQFDVNISWASDEKVSMKLIQSISGKQFDLGDIQLKNGNQNLNLNINNKFNQMISSGLYTIQIIGKDTNKQAQFIYLKK